MSSGSSDTLVAAGDTLCGFSHFPSPHPTTRCPVDSPPCQILRIQILASKSSRSPLSARMTRRKGRQMVKPILVTTAFKGKPKSGGEAAGTQPRRKRIPLLCSCWCSVDKSCLTFCDPVDCNWPGLASLALLVAWHSQRQIVLGTFSNMQETLGAIQKPLSSAPFVPEVQPQH